MAEAMLVDLSEGVAALKERIGRQTSAQGREWEKVAVLAADDPYMDFLAHVTGGSAADVSAVLEPFAADDRFRSEFAPRLAEFESDTGLVHGDVRLHSLTLYAVTRLLKPSVVLETGVASGKSSAIILLALEHNGQGRLVSIDLPNEPGETLPDGALTHTGGRPVGWLVPDYLRSRWDLRLGDARELLPAAVAELEGVDLFFHDSLHTREHVLFELGTVAGALRPPAIILLDNVDVADGALQAFAAAHRLPGAIFGDFGGVRVSDALDASVLVE